MKLSNLLFFGFASTLPVVMASSWPPPYGKEIEANFFAGGKGGSKATHEDINNPLKKIEVWGTAHSVKAIRITYGDSDSQKTFGVPGKDGPQVISLAEGEKFSQFSAWSGPFVRKISLKTTKGQVLTLGDSTQADDASNRIDMEVGSGYLAGLYVTADPTKIFRLKPYFLNKVVLGRTYNLQGGGNGGNQFSEVRLNERVKSVTIWWGGSDYGNTCRAIEITWEGGQKTQLYGNTHRSIYSGSHTFHLAQQERIIACSMRVGVRVDQFAFTTNLGTKRVWGGPLGNYFSVPDLGTGVLIGFEGRTGGDMDKLAPVFAKIV